MAISFYSPANVPVLETERLRLRGHCIDDFSDSAAMWADPAVTRYIGDKPLTEEESWTKFLRYVGHWSLLGFGYWVVEEKATGHFAGEIGFADYKRDLQPSLKGVPEIGWSSPQKRTARGMRRKRFGQSLPGAMFTSDRLGPPASSLPRTLSPFGSPRNVDIVNSS